jgi:hypothetical protein
MLADIVESTTGFPCETVDEAGNMVLVDAPQIFPEEPEVYLYVLRRNGKLCLSDDGEVLGYFGGILRQMYEPMHVEEICSTVHSHGLTIEQGRIELWCEEAELASAFDKFMDVMGALAAREMAMSERRVKWIREQIPSAAK